MKRSEINRAIREGLKTLDKICFRLPDFSRWSHAKWVEMRAEASEIIKTGMGWDVTDFGSNNFTELGTTIFTLRNGSVYDEKIGVPYAEKVLIQTEGQKIPLHFHFKKAEDIINRGNGVLCVMLYNSKSDESLDKSTAAKIKLDGIWKTFQPGETFEVLPGNSITVPPNLYHAFWAKKGAGTLVCGEVSSINDDHLDNRFHVALPRFVEIEEDEPIEHILCNEYERVLGQ